MKIHEYNEMMAWLKKPKRLFSSRKDTIGGGAIQGQDLGSRMGFAGPVLLKTGENKGKYKVRFRDPKFGKREGQSGFNEGDKFFATKEEADAFYQDLLSKKDEKKAAGLAKKNVAVEKQAKQINDFVNTFVDKNITNFDVRDYVNFRKDLLKEFNKTKIGYASGRNALYKGLPNVGIEEAENYFKKLFYTNKINSDPTFQKRIGDYLEYYNIDKKFYGGSELDKEAKILARKQYADVLDNAGDVLFVLGDDKVGIGKFRSSIVKQFFPEEMEIYNRKKQASGAAYEEKLAQIEERLGQKKLKQVLNGETSIKRFMTKQSDILKDIFDLSTLDEGLRFNLDHAEGIAEIAKMENSNDIMRALNNLIGMTQSRNYELGWRGYSTSRKNLLNKIEQGIDVDKSLKQLNDLTKSVYPETQGKDAYKIIKGKVTPTKNFQFMYEPEKAFRQYFTELSTKDVGAKALLEQAKPGSELVQFLTKDEKTYEKIANNLFDKIKQNENVSLEELTSLRKTYKNQKEEALQEFGRLFCRTNSATGGRINLAQAGSPNICSPEEMLSNMKKDKIIAQGTDDAAALAKGRLLKAGKSVGKVLGYVAAPVDIAIELAFAGPSLLRGDVQGAINATTFGMLGGGKTGMEQVGEKFGKDSTEYALYGIEESIKDKMVAMDGLEKLFSESEQLGLIPSEEGVMQKQIGLEPQQKALLKQFANQFKNLGDLDKKATQNFETFYPLTIDKMQNTKALQNIANFSTSQQPLAEKLDPNTIEGFIKSGGGVFEKEMLPRFTLPQYEENIRKLQELRIADFPLYLQSQLAGYEESQIPSEEERQLMLQQRQETPLDFVVPYDQIRYKGYRYGGRIQFANGGRLSFAEGPEDPKKRATLKKIGIGGGIAGGLATGLINILDLFKGGAKKGVVATKAAQSQAEKLFFDLVNAVKNKGIIDKLDRASDFSRGGAYYEYKGVKVLEDGENIELQFTTDKGAPAVVEYRKPSYDVDPEAGTSYKVPGEFTNEGQEIARYGKDGDVDIDFENEIIDPIENVKKIIDD
jgi:hypothetical protein